MAGAKSSNSSPARARAVTLWVTLSAVALAASAAVLFWFDPIRNSFYPRCLFHQSTGLLCPGCGSLRALHQLLHGRVAVAFHDNALLVSALPLLGFWAANCLLRKLRHQPVNLGVNPVWLWLALAAVVVFGVARNLPVQALAWMRP